MKNVTKWSTECDELTVLSVSCVAEVSTEVSTSDTSDNWSIILTSGKLWSTFLHGMSSLDNLHWGCIGKESLNGQNELEESFFNVHMGIWLHCEPVLRAQSRVFTVGVGDRRLAAVKSFRWLAPQKHAKHTTGSRQLLCGTNALHWVRDAKADFHSVHSQQDQGERNSLSFVQRLTNCDVKLMCSRNLLPPIAPPFASSFLTDCTQHVHTSGDGILWRPRVITLCCGNEMREWSGFD